jgi:hypothetical protein
MILTVLLWFYLVVNVLGAVIAPIATERKYRDLLVFFHVLGALIAAGALYLLHS